MNPYLLTCYQSPFPKIRVGKEFDGGYIIADTPDTNGSVLLAAGICDDISFEENFVTRYANTYCYAFDGTIQQLPPSSIPITDPDISTQNKILFINKNIGPTNTETTTNLHELIDANEHLFLKMDIEGAEIPWLKTLNIEQLNKFNQIVMEFHTPFSNEEIDVFNKLNQTHYLVHFHGNNCCGVRNHRGVNIPNVFECTYLNKKYFNGAIPPFNTEAIPSPIDMQNKESVPDIMIDYPPFVYSHP
jgi:hypothetical protein